MIVGAEKKLPHSEKKEKRNKVKRKWKYLYYYEPLACLEEFPHLRGYHLYVSFWPLPSPVLFSSCSCSFVAIRRLVPYASSQESTFFLYLILNI